MRANRDSRPELETVGRTKVNLSDPKGSLFIGWGEGYKVTTLSS